MTMTADEYLIAIAAARKALKAKQAEHAALPADQQAAHHLYSFAYAEYSELGRLQTDYRHAFASENEKAAADAALLAGFAAMRPAVG